MKIIVLKAANIKRLKAVEIRPGNDPLVLIGGKNAAGKTSVLDSIMYALAGGKSLPEQPVRTGQSKAKVRLELGDLVVERTFSRSGSKLAVYAKDGSPQQSPQALLDALCTRIAFDPLAFSQLSKQAQGLQLQQLSGYDTSDLDEKRDAVYGQRTVQNREVKRLTTEHAAISYDEKAPDEEVSVVKLADELHRRQEQIYENDSMRAEAEGLREQEEAAISRTTAVELAVSDAKDILRDLIAAHEQAVLDAQQDITLAERKLSTHFEVVQRAHERADAVSRTAAQLTDPVLGPVRDQLDRAEDTNRAVRTKQKATKLRKALDEVEALADALSDQIEELDAQKLQRQREANFPIDGLGIDDEGAVTLGGLPLSQASEAQRLRLSVAMGFALNPRLKVLLIRNGSGLDSDTMQLLTELTAAEDGQLWIERMSVDGAGCSVLIEDGAVAKEKAL